MKRREKLCRNILLTALALIGIWLLLGKPLPLLPDYRRAERTYFLEPKAIVHVMRQDGHVVGYMRVYLWNTNSAVSAKRTVLSIDDIGVDEALRNQGIGTQMMTQLVTLAKEEWGCSSICLYVDAPNESARAYYEKCGFQVRNIGMSLSLYQATFNFSGIFPALTSCLSIRTVSPREPSQPIPQKTKSPALYKKPYKSRVLAYNERSKNSRTPAEYMNNPGTSQGVSPEPQD